MALASESQDRHEEAWKPGRQDLVWQEKRQGRVKGRFLKAQISVFAGQIRGSRERGAWAW
jgi:hypothetical protein